MIGKLLDACRKANAFLQKIWPLLTGLGVAFGAVTLSGCGTMQTPSSKTQTSSVYAFGLPAVAVSVAANNRVRSRFMVSCTWGGGG